VQEDEHDGNITNSGMKMATRELLKLFQKGVRGDKGE
jgi:hypothetical protein